MYHLSQNGKSKLPLNKLEETCLYYELSFTLCDLIKTRGRDKQDLTRNAYSVFVRN